MNTIGDIRKIAVGPDYKNAMHFETGQRFSKGTLKVECIKRDEDTGHMNVYVENEKKEVSLYKSFSPSMPISIEYNLNF